MKIHMPPLNMTTQTPRPGFKPWLVVLGFLLSLVSLTSAAPAPIRVVASTPDLASLTQEVGGERVKVSCLTEGPEDPHTLNVRPGMVRELNSADLFVQVGLGIENAWLKDLLAGVKNNELKPGGKANLNLGQATRLLEGIEREGTPNSFHEEGNPHYLLDPVEGLRAAKTICDRLIVLRPEWASEIEKRHESFQRRLTVLLVGEECAGEKDLDKVLLQFEQAKSRTEIDALLKEHRLGGWMGRMLPHRGTLVVGDHDLWPYFARRYGLSILGYLEPSPGSPPTTRHLQGLITQMKDKKVGILLSAPYFEERHAKFVAKRTEVKVLPMAHQTGARPGAEDFIAMTRFNAEQLLQELERKP
ncbi:MAG: zinc ABC transporter substrate-binding protein [Verrucomicrobia bacterium]|nr:zinc ABC transporter substrate-binding protein [Verrucomicrobiota bacterium]